MCPSDAPRGPDIVLLAAGRGRRLGIDGHKALLPLRDGAGTLALLLDALTRLPVGRIHLVTGHAADSVAAAARAIVPDVRCVHNPDPAGTEMLQSLAIALEDRPAPARDVWVLSADTLYAPQVLAGLLAVPEGRLAVAVAPSDALSGREVGVVVRGDRVCRLGRDLSGATHRMAHAVRWPVRWQERVTDGARAGLRFQWEVLDRLLSRSDDRAAPAIRAVRVTAGAAADLDTPADLAVLRQRLASPSPS